MARLRTLLLVPSVALCFFLHSRTLSAQTKAAPAAGAVQEFAVPDSANHAAEAAKPLASISLVADKGTALSLSLDNRIPIKTAGASAEAHVVEPVYAFDRE